MARKIALVPYALRLRDKNERCDYVTNRLPNNSTLQQHVVAYLNNRLTDTSINDVSLSAIRTDSLNKSGSTLQGIIKCGEYGFTAELENLESGHQFRREIKDCEFLPFYYQFTFRDGQNEAIVLLQKFGINGIKTIIENDLGTFVESRVPDSKLSLNPIVSEEYVRELLGGGIKRLRYTKFSVPADIADDIGADDHIENLSTMELIFKAKRNSFLSIPEWMRLGQIDKSNIIEINSIEYDNVKLDIDIGGKIQTVDLSDIKKFRMALDVTDNVIIGNDGHPTYNSMTEAAEGIMPLVCSAIRWEDA